VSTDRQTGFARLPELNIVDPLRLLQGTGKGFHGSNGPTKGHSQELDYLKLVPGYVDMSRPQKYRARKHLKSVRMLSIPEAKGV